MLSPEYLNLIEFNDVVELYNQLNIEITADIITRVAQMQEVTQTSIKQLKVLKQTNGMEVFNKALEKTSMLTAETKKKLKQLFEDMASEDLEGYKKLYQYRDKPFKLSDTQYKILNQGLQDTNRLLKNFSNTIAFQSKQAYVEAVDSAYMKVASGAFDYGSAIHSACQELANKGITLKDKLGRNVQLDVAVRRNILTGIQQTANNINRDIEEYLGCDGYEVTAHLGARPSHAEAQGKQYAINHNTKISRDYPLWGDVQGLWGEYNCRHTYFGIILGVSEPKYSAKELKEFREATVILNGKRLPYYEATQKQRQLENAIRKQKRTVQTLEKANLDHKLEKGQLAQLQRKYNNFCKETGLEKDYSRTQITKSNVKNKIEPIFKQEKIENKKQLMNFQENTESFRSNKIKPTLYSDVTRKNNIVKYENKIMELYKKNKKENMAILESKQGELFGNITTGKRMTVGPDTKTLAKMLIAKKNSLIVIHNHPKNYSFSLTDIETFNKINSIKTMILLTDNYKYYLTFGNGNRIKTKELIKDYTKIENMIKKKYKTFNDIEIRDLTNQEFFKRKGWLYEKEKSKIIKK